MLEFKEVKIESDVVKLEFAENEEIKDTKDPITKATRNELLLNLNEQQIQAVKFRGAPLLILAGVGTGKTETLMMKYAYLYARGHEVRSIMSVTFTNKAATEM